MPRAALIKCVAMQRYTMPKTLLMIAGQLANRNRNGYGKLSTHWRTGCLGKTSSTSSAALSAMRRASQLAQKAGTKEAPLWLEPSYVPL